MLKPPEDRCAGPSTSALADLGWVKAVFSPCSYKLLPLSYRKKESCQGEMLFAGL